jgi:NIMA (never in mitosis gene a)-related kinase
MDKYEVLTEIGKGSFGKVFKIRRKEDNRILVWKEM